MATIALDVVTPNGSVFHEEDCEIVVLQTVQGELGVMAGHIPTVTPLKIGVLRAKIDGKFEYLAVTEGFAEVRPELRSEERRVGSEWGSRNVRGLTDN